MTYKKALNTPKFVHQNVHQKKDKRKRNEVFFSDVVIRNLKPSEKRIEYWCEGLTGFGIRVSESGTKTWLYVYRVNGKKDRLFLGKYPKVPLREARQAYFDALEKIEHGINPAEEKRAEKKRFELLISEQGKNLNKASTISELVKDYIEYCKFKNKKSWKEELNAFNKDLLPLLGNVKVTEVSTEENIELLDKMFNDIIEIRNAISMADHLYSYTRRLFNYGAKKKLIRYKDNPCHEIHLDIERQSRQRHLSFEEVYKLWYGLDKVRSADCIKLGLKMMLCTVSRGIEIREMQWQHLSDKNTIWTLPTSKNNKMHRVHLCSLSQDIIQKIKPLTEKSKYVFASTHRGMSLIKDIEKLEPVAKATYSQVVNKQFDALGITEKFTPHDLRRTAATIVASMLGKKELLKKLLNHTNQDVTDIYDQYLYDDEKKQGQEALNHALKRIISSPSIKDIPTLEELKMEVRELLFSSHSLKKKTKRVSSSYFSSYTLSYSTVA